MGSNLWKNWEYILTNFLADSLKKFEQCTLCLNILTDPQSCVKGHVFCKECIIENLLFQKKEIKKRVIDWKNKNPKKEIDKITDHSDTMKKIESLKNVEEGIMNTTEEITLDHALMADNDIKRFDMIQDFEKKKKVIFNRDKTEMTRNCFWIPEITPAYVEEDKGRPCE